MTATEPTPTAEHTERAPASIVGEFIDDEALMATGRSIGVVASFRVATALLAEPTMHAALAASLPADVMLAALVRAGVLTERFAIRDEGGSVWLDAHGDHREAKPGGMEFADRSDAEGIVARPHEEVMRRLVTPWEVAP